MSSWRSPDFAPVVVRRTSDAPVIGPTVIRPSLARKSAIMASFQVMVAGLTGIGSGSCRAMGVSA